MAPDVTRRYPYQDPQVDVDRRVEDLLGRMTIGDKVSLLFHTMTYAGDLDGTNRFIPMSSPRVLIGELGLTHLNVVGSTDARSFAAWHNALQELALAHPLAIPLQLSSDPRNHFTDNAFSSMVAGPFSLWPEPLGLAAIGSEELVETFADTARQEYRAVGLRASLHPQIDLATEPRWGRISHTFGEDADLTSRLAVAYIRGFQGDALGPASVATMVKHFPGGGPQQDGTDPHFPWGREQVYPAGCFEYHLEPFRAAIDAGAAQVMPYYGMPVGTEYEEVGFSYNRSIITGILRERLGFDGVVCTDWCLITDRPGMGDIGIAKAWGVEHLSREERVVKLLGAGVDQFGGEECTELVLGLVRAGRLTEARIDESARRILRLKFTLGVFEQPFVDEDAAASVVGCAAFREAGIRAQQRAATLLTNEPGIGGSSTLPLRRGLRVYVEGIAADALDGYAQVVGSPADADVAVLRLKTPWEPLPGGGLADGFHSGSLAFPAEEEARIVEICATVPTVLDLYLERPAVLGALASAAKAIVANYGLEEVPLVELLFAEASPEGNLPFDLPCSMDAVLASDSDAPFDTQDPAFRFGRGLRYGSTA